MYKHIRLYIDSIFTWIVTRPCGLSMRFWKDYCFYLSFSFFHYKIVFAFSLFFFAYTDPDLLIMKYTHVSILFIYHSFKLVKGGFICKLFEDRWGIFFIITSRHFDIWYSQFSVQYWTFFGTSIFGNIFLFFEVHRKRITNLKLM